MHNSFLRVRDLDLELDPDLDWEKGRTIRTETRFPQLQRQHKLFIPLRKFLLATEYITGFADEVTIAETTTA